MLDEKDLQAIQQLIIASESRMMDRIETSVKETETRMMSYIESAVMPKFGEVETRMMSYIESAVMPKFGETESRMAAYMEAYFDPKFNALADGQKLLRETMASKSRYRPSEKSAVKSRPPAGGFFISPAVIVQAAAGTPPQSAPGPAGPARDFLSP